MKRIFSRKKAESIGLWFEQSTGFVVFLQAQRQTIKVVDFYTFDYPDIHTEIFSELLQKLLAQIPASSAYVLGLTPKQCIFRQYTIAANIPKADHHLILGDLITKEFMLPIETIHFNFAYKKQDQEKIMLESAITKKDFLAPFIHYFTQANRELTKTIPLQPTLYQLLNIDTQKILLFPFEQYWYWFDPILLQTQYTKILVKDSNKFELKQYYELFETGDSASKLAMITPEPLKIDDLLIEHYFLQVVSDDKIQFLYAYAMAMQGFEK